MIGLRGASHGGGCQDPGGMPVRILNSYIARSYLALFSISLAVFVFVMAVVNIFRVLDIFARGASGRVVIQVFSYGIPYYLIFAIPMSVLAASFLLFKRMSDDGEITAMKACGISIWQIIQPPVFIAACLAAVCVYINFSLAPASHYARRKMVGELGIENPADLLDQGRFIRDFPGLAIYVGRKYGNRLGDIVVHRFGDDGLKQTVYARSGTIASRVPGDNRLVVMLRDVRIEQADEKHPEDLDRMRHISAREYPIDIDVSGTTGRRRVWKTKSNLSMYELFNGVLGVPVFMSGDFVDLERIAHRLSNPRDRMGVYLRSLLPQDTRKIIDGHDGSRASDESLEQALIRDFNILIRRPDFYNERVFAQARVHLSEKAQDILRTDPAGGVLLTQLNRKLIEDAFPGTVAENLLLSLRPRAAEIHRMSLMVEASTRLALSFCCFAFAILGIAVGVKIHRKESSIGVAFTLLMIFFFYFFIIIADSLVVRPEFQPHLVVWFPFLIAEGVGYHLLRKAA